MALFEKWFKFTYLAIILSGFIWPSAHIPVNVSPFYLRLFREIILGITLEFLLIYQF